MKLIAGLLINTLSVFVAASLVPGVHVPDFITAFVVALVLGMLNAFLKPILLLLTLPINILTLGLFTFVINVGLLLLTAQLVTGFSIDGVISAILFGLVMSIVNYFLNIFLK